MEEEKNHSVNQEQVHDLLFGRELGWQEIIYDLIKKKLNNDKRRVCFVYGGTDVEGREEIRNIVESENKVIIVASIGVFSTGVNMKRLNHLIFASPTKSKIQVFQSIGRSLRTADGKNSAILYDISDDLRLKNKRNFTLEHSSDRIKFYINERFDYKIHSINM